MLRAEGRPGVTGGGPCVWGADPCNSDGTTQEAEREENVD